MPDPLRPKRRTKASPKEPTILNIPVGLCEAIPHGTVVLVAQDNRIERIIVRHAATLEAFVDGNAPGLKVLVYDPRIGAPPFQSGISLTRIPYP